MKIKLLRVIMILTKYTLYSIIIQCICLNVLLANESLGQKKQKLKEIYVTMNAFENTPIEKVFSVLESKTNFTFSYDRHDLNGETLTLERKIHKMSLHDYLLELSRNSNLKFKRINENIHVSTRSTKERRLTEILSTKEIFDKEITGTITDENNIGLAGVSVIVKGTLQGVVTDVDGKYKLSVPDNSTLVFSYIGYVSEEIEVGNTSIIDVQLVPDIATLSEIVVTGYQTLSRERTTGSFSVIDKEEFNSKIISTPLERLEGQASGLLINGNNEIIIRGQSTLSADKQPLVVIDGFPTSLSTSDVLNLLLNPDDIENINILKDATASSIWGAKSSNGVIVITTKRGSMKANAKTVVEFTSGVTIGSKNDFDDLQYMSSSQLLDVEKEYFDRNFLPIPAFDTRPYSRGQEVFREISLGVPGAEQKLENLRRADGYQQNQNLLQQTPIKQRYNLNIRGGAQKYSYYFSTAYNTNAFVNKGNSNDQININLNNQFKVIDNLSVDLTLNTIFVNSKDNGINISGNQKPYDLLRDENGENLALYQYHDTPLHFFAANVGAIRNEYFLSRGYLDWMYRPLQEQALADNTSKRNESKIQLAVNYDFLKNFSFSSKFQYEFGNSTNDQYYDKDSYIFRDIYNLTTLDEPSGPNQQLPYGDIYDVRKSSSRAFLIRNQIDYNNSINEDKHRISAIIGSEVSKSLVLGQFNRLWGYDRATLIDIRPDCGENCETVQGFSVSMPNDHSISENENRFFSLYSNASYTYNDKYTIDGSIRIDQSNLFGTNPEFRYQPIWSAGFNWNLSREDFFGVNWVDRLLFKVTYGINGNVANLVTPNLTARSSLRNFTDIPTLVITDPENDFLRWEKSKILNLTIEYALFNHRVSGDIQLYNKRGIDLLGVTEIDPTNGFASITQNTSSIDNKGIDMNVTGTILDGPVKWISTLNLGYNKGKVIENAISDNRSFFGWPTYMRGSIEGQPIDGLASYRWAGLNNEGLAQVYDAEGNVITAGTVMEDLDALVFKNTAPKFFGAFITNLHYKGFRLSATFNYKLGYFMRSPARINDFSASSGSRVPSKHVTERWGQVGDENITNIPRIANYRWESFDVPNYDEYYNLSDILIENASHVRLRFVVLSYSLPQSILQSSPFSKVELSAQGRNLWLWTANDLDIDPDFNRGGTLSFTEGKSFTFGLRASF